MNERIKELAYDAEDYADTMVDGGSEFHPTFVKKFAELIVRECATWVNDNLGLVDEEARKDLLKHFGVEE